jgi:isopentenyl-diphosphate Delta-isomerase
LARIDPSLSLFGKKLAAPILISSMTGGTEEAGEINQRLAEAAQEVGVAMGVGSQRAALEHPEQTPTFSIVRETAPGYPALCQPGSSPAQLRLWDRPLPPRRGHDWRRCPDPSS